MGLTGVSGRTYNIINFMLSDDSLNEAGRYIDALNLARAIGCVNARHDAYIRWVIARLVRDMKNIERYAAVFGFNFIVHTAAKGEDGLSNVERIEGYVPYIWPEMSSNGDDASITETKKVSIATALVGYFEHYGTQIGFENSSVGDDADE